jgi:hypothetical protein
MNMECKGLPVSVLLLCMVDGEGDDGEDDDLSLTFLLVAGGALTTLIPKALPMGDLDCL